MSGETRYLCTFVTKDERMNADKSVNFRYILLPTLVAALGGLLFGYDTAVISGAIGYVRSFFGLDAVMTGWAASSALLGCVFGAAFAGVIGDWLGRKKALIICAILFMISAIGSAIPNSVNQLVLARFINGLGVGAASMLSPLYIAEISPEKIRGRLVALYQLAVVIGIVMVFFVNMLIQRAGNEAWNTVTGWRWMLGSEAFPAVLLGVLLIPVPESPRWLMKAGRQRQASEILTRMVGSERGSLELEQIEKSLSHEQGKLSELFTSGYRKALIIGILLAFFQQTSGINVIMYFATEMFKDVGSNTNGAFLSTVFIGVINLIFTFLAILLVDKAGRKILLIVGTGLQFLTLSIIGFLFHIKGSPVVLLVFMLIYTASFAMAMGPIVWIVISEIFPNKIRGRAMSIATLTLWMTCFLVTNFYPLLKERIGNATAFWLYAVSSLCCMFFVMVFVPETKERTLEEIEDSWTKA